MSDSFSTENAFELTFNYTTLVEKHKIDFPLFNFPFIWHSHTHSTNELAKTITLNPVKKVTWICTAFQTHGKGQAGKTWHSHKNESFLASMIIPPHWIPHVSLIKWVISGSVVLFLIKKGLSGITIKAPNDVLVQGKKISGILTESVWRADSIERVITGVGINILQKKFDPLIPYTLSPTSLVQENPLLFHTDALFLEWCQEVHTLLSFLACERFFDSVAPWFPYIKEDDKVTFLSEITPSKKTSPSCEKMIDDLHKLRYFA